MYFNVIINETNNWYYFQQTDRKPRNYDPEGVLKKIETILKNNYVYNPTRLDEYCHRPEHELKGLLKIGAGQIEMNYIKKVKKFNPFRKFFYNNEKNRIKKLSSSIFNHSIDKEPVREAAPLRGLRTRHGKNIDADPLGIVATHLGIPEVAVLGRVNKDLNRQMRSELVKRAEQLGYKRSVEQVDLDEGARQHLMKVSNQIGSFFKAGLLPKKYLVMKGKNIDIEATLKKLETVPPDKYIKIFNDPKYYYQKFYIRYAQSESTVSQKLAVKRDLATFEPLLIKCAEASFRTPIKPSAVPIPDQINRRGDFLCTPLFLAVASHRQELIRFFIQQGATFTTREGSTLVGFQPLHFAVFDPQILENFITAGADPNVLDRYNATPLMYCAVNNNVEGLKMLLEHGAILTLTNVNGKTALDFAREHHQTEAVVLLEEAARQRNP